MKFVGVTSCPTGIAHTYMAAEALEIAAEEAGHTMQVETQGSAGSTPLSQADIDAADAVIFAHDLEVKDKERFARKPTVDVGVKRGVSDAPALIAQAEQLATERAANPSDAAAADGGSSTATAPAGSATASAGSTTGSTAGASGSSGLTTKAASEEAGVGTKIRQWLMTGVSYMIPFVAAGGIMIALGFMLAQLFGGKQGAIDVTKYSLTTPAGASDALNLAHNFSATNGMHWAGLLFIIGGAAFGFLVPILSGFIAFGIADRPGLVPGIVGGSIAVTMGAGFLGGIATGFIAGFAARWISGWNVPNGVRGVMPVVVIPLLSTLITGALFILVLGRPIKALFDALTNALNGMSGSNAVLLGIILGLMMGFDLGGPVNKVAYTFGTTGIAAAGLSDGAPQLKIMAAVMGAGMVAPLGLALATTVRKNLFTKAEQQNGRAAWLLGASFISEGAIPFAAADPWRVIASSMVGSAVTGGLCMAFGATSRAPHGGIWVSPLIGHAVLFILAVIIGAVVTAAMVIVLKSTAKVKTADLAAA